ncbi:hypothetical protein Sjap_015505 [Stephania japonica]|uniref:Uncharacterized protein n=1 Tax=Stephania japonica TaxID=461633 RepID=A0AAP0NRF3_9MAGN
MAVTDLKEQPALLPQGYEKLSFVRDIKNEKKQNTTQQRGRTLLLSTRLVWADHDATVRDSTSRPAANVDGGSDAADGAKEPRRHDIGGYSKHGCGGNSDSGVVAVAVPARLWLLVVLAHKEKEGKGR